MKRVALVSLAVLVASLGSRAAAWEGLTPSNPVWGGPVIYSLNSAGSADLGGFGPTEAIVRQGMDDWTRVSCSSLTTSYQGSTTAPPETRNTISWIEAGWPHDSNAIGVTTPRFSGSNLIDASMEMNGVHFTWTTDPGSGSRVNAYSIALHEGGHYHGLGHSRDPSATMYFAYSGGVSNLNADDETGICTLYPGGGGGATDCTTTGCPGGQICNTSGTCVDPPPVGGSGGTCDGCASDAACDGLCLQYPDGRGYCGSTCGNDADCGGSNETCEPVSDGSSRCVRRRPADGAATCAIDAGTVAPDPDPEPDPTPDPGTPECSTSRDCRGSELCNADARCVPVPAGAVGDACEGNGDCDSGLCAVDSLRDETFCTDLCADDSGCPAGFECLPVGGGMNACSPNDGLTSGPGASDPSAAPYPSGLTGSCSASPSAGNSAPFGGLALLVLATLIRRRRTS